MLVAIPEHLYAAFVAADEHLRAVERRHDETVGGGKRLTTDASKANVDRLRAMIAMVAAMRTVDDEPSAEGP